MTRASSLRVLSAAAAISVGACRASVPTPTLRPTTPDAAFRAGPPAPPPALKFSLPKIQEVRLQNGIRLLLAPRHELPIVSVVMASRRGADATGPGIASVYANALSQGASLKYSPRFGETLLKNGGSGYVNIDHDETELRVKVLAPGLPAIVETLRMVALQDVFLQPSVDAGRVLQTAARRRIEERPSGVALITLAEMLYPEGHPYRRPAIGDVDSLAEVSAPDVRRFHRVVFDAGALGIAIAGDFDEKQVIDELGPMLGELPDRKADIPERLPRPQLPPGAVVTIVDRPGTSQTRVFVGALGVTGADPDRMALRVAGIVLSERITFNLRETHAYTYASFTDVHSAPNVGAITLGGAIETAHAAEALKEILAELARASTQPPSEVELNMARTADLADTAAIFESTDRTARWLARIASGRGSIADLEDEVYRPGAVMAADVARVVKTYLATDALRVVLVGDASKFLAAVEAMGLGKIDVRHAAPVTKPDEPLDTPPPE